MLQPRLQGRGLGEEVSDLHTSKAQPGGEQSEPHRIQHQQRDATHLRGHRLADGECGRGDCGSGGGVRRDVQTDVQCSPQTEASAEHRWILRNVFLSVSDEEIISVAADEFVSTAPVEIVTSPPG